MNERRNSGEVRLAGRTLTGVVMAYGDVSPEHSERFLPGAFGPEPRAALDVQHDPSLIVLPAERVALTDGPESLILRADLPPRSGAHSLVQRGALNGLSVEFVSQAEHRDASGVRVIERANLIGIGLVDSPSYPGSTVEARRGLGRLFSMRGAIPTGKRVACRCGPGDCVSALFKQGSFRSLTAAAIADDDDLVDEVLAVVGDYSAPVASRKRKSVRFWNDGDGNLQWAVDVPDTARGRALKETIESVDVLARPVMDMQRSKWVREGTTAIYADAQIRALTIGATDAAEGWTPAYVRKAASDDMPERSTARPVATRRAALWRL
ncbi:MAG: HK97 family phage prohead protease [Boseongicola sp.]|nr:HK97 family phage prohead protease [Boseongicola sp.]